MPLKFETITMLYFFLVLTLNPILLSNGWFSPLLSCDLARIFTLTRRSFPRLESVDRRLNTDIFLTGGPGAFLPFFLPLRLQPATHHQPSLGTGEKLSTYIMDRVSEWARSSRRTREERDRDEDGSSSIRDREIDRDRKKHRHHHDGEERRHERHRDAERHLRSLEDSPSESDCRRHGRSPDRHKHSVEHRHRSRGDNSLDVENRARESVERDRDVDRPLRRSSREDCENGGENMHDRSSNKSRKSDEREGISYEETTERIHKKRKDKKGSDGEETENYNARRARVSDTLSRKSTHHFKVKDTENVSVLSEDDKLESKKGKILADRRKEEMVDEDKKSRQKKEEINGSSRHGRRSHDDTKLKSKLVAEELHETDRKDRRFKDVVKGEKLERSILKKPTVSSERFEFESQIGLLANDDKSNKFPSTSDSLATTNLCTLEVEPVIEELHETVRSHVLARKRTKGTSMTDEQRAAQRIYNQSYASRRNARMTEAQRAAQRASNRERARERKAQMTEKQRQAQRAYNQSRQRVRRAHMTETQQAHQREIWRTAAQRRRQQLPQQSEQLQNQNSEVQCTVAPPPQTTVLAAASNNEHGHSNMT